jgi:uncharacterized protein YuzE
MLLTVDNESDAFYLQLATGEVDDTLQLTPYIFVDIDKMGRPLGLEILFAKRVLGQTDLSQIQIKVADMGLA